MLFIVLLHFDDDDARAPLHCRHLAAKARTQINHRHHGATQIDHAPDEAGHHGDFGQVAVLDDFLHVQDAYSEHLAAHVEREVLVGVAAVHRLGGATRTALGRVGLMHKAFLGLMVPRQ